MGDGGGGGGKSEAEGLDRENRERGAGSRERAGNVQLPPIVRLDVNYAPQIGFLSLVA